MANKTKPTVLNTKKLGAHRVTFAGLKPGKALEARARDWLDAQVKKKAAKFSPASAVKAAALTDGALTQADIDWLASYGYVPDAQSPIGRVVLDTEFGPVIGLNFNLVPNGAHVLRELAANDIDWINRSGTTAPPTGGFWGVFRPLEPDGSTRYVFTLKLTGFPE